MADCCTKQVCKPCDCTDTCKPCDCTNTCKPCNCKTTCKPCDCENICDPCYCTKNNECCNLMVSFPAPDFEGDALMADGSFSKIKLSSFKGQYVVLFYYPLDFTFVCPTEIIAFSDRVEEFTKIGCSVIAASCDSHFSHHAWSKVPRKSGGISGMKIPILADKNGKIAKKYGIYLEKQGISLRGLFIIDPNGILRQIIVNDLPVGRDVDEVLRLVKAYKFTDEHGEVCPVNWKEGQKALNTKYPSDFFSSTY